MADVKATIRFHAAKTGPKVWTMVLPTRLAPKVGGDSHLTELAVGDPQGFADQNHARYKRTVEARVERGDVVMTLEYPQFLDYLEAGPDDGEFSFVYDLRNVRRWRRATDFAIQVTYEAPREYLDPDAKVRCVTGKKAHAVTQETKGKILVATAEVVKFDPNWLTCILSRGPTFSDEALEIRERVVSDSVNGAKILAAAASKFKKLELWNGDGSDEGYAAIDRIGTLRTLALYDFDRADALIARLKGLKNLRRLQLIDTDLGPEGRKALGALGALEELVYTASKPSEFSTLNALVNLTSLDLRGDGITDAELAKLRLKRRLRWISLKFTAVTRAGLDAFLKEHPLTRVATFEGIH